MISYLIFQDSLKPKLTSIFETSSSKSLYEISRQNLFENDTLDGLNVNWFASHNGNISHVQKNQVSLDCLDHKPKNIIKYTRGSLNNPAKFGYVVQNSKKLTKTELNVGDVFTLSAWIYVPAEYKNQAFNLGIFDLNDKEEWKTSYMKEFKAVGDSWQYVSHTFKIVTENDKIFAIGFANNLEENVDGFYYLAGFKLEKGKYPTRM